MPVIQVDWNRILERFADTTAFYAFTHRQASLLLSLSQQLNWEKTFRVFGYDFDEYDDVELEVADLQHNLTMPVNLVDLLEYIDDIEDLLIALQSTANCCDVNSDISDGDYYTDEIEDGVGDVPQNIIDAGYATDAGDWEGFQDYKCMISHVIIDSMESKLRMLAPFVDNAGIVIGGIATIVSIATVIFTSGMSVLALGILASTGSVALLYKLITSGGILVAMADDVRDDHDALACAVYEGDGSAGSLEALDDKIDELYIVPVTTILKNLNLGPELKALYGGRYNQQDIAAALLEAGYELDSFDCTCEELEEGQLIPNPSWEGGTAGWSVGGDWEWSVGSGDHLGILSKNVDDEEDYSELQSANFFIPEGVTSVRPQMRALGRLGKPSHTVFVRLHDASDDSIIGWEARLFDEADNEYETLDAYDPITVVAETECYVQVKSLNGSTAYGQFIDWIKLWED